MGSDHSAAKRLVGAIYSRAAENLYEPIVVQRAFPLLGGNLNDLVLEQGQDAVASADGAPILDMPVGTAYFTTAIARQHAGIVVGVDIADGMVRQADLAAREAGITNLLAVQADAHKLPFPDACFGAVLCTNGLQVIPGLSPTVKELVRVLRPGGMVFVSFLSAPLTQFMSATRRSGLPALMRPREDVLEAFSEAGIHGMTMRRQRLATLLRGAKPA